MTTIDSVQAIEAEATRLAEQAQQARAELQERERALHAEREERQRQVLTTELQRMRTETIPAAQREQAEAAAALAEAVTSDPLGAALVRVLTASHRYRAITVEANDLAANVGAEPIPTAAMQPAPDVLHLIVTAARDAARRTVVAEQAQARQERQEAVLDSGRLPRRPVLDHAELMAAERRRANEDQRLQTLLKLTPDEVAALDAGKRVAKLAEADAEEDHRQRKVRGDFRAEQDRARQLSPGLA